MIRSVVVELFDDMVIYCIARYYGWFLLTFSVFMLITNRSQSISYFMFTYSCVWVYFTNEYGAQYQYRREILISMQAGFATHLGELLAEGVMFAIQLGNIPGTTDDLRYVNVSPAGWLIGILFISTLFILTLTSLFEVITTNEKSNHSVRIAVISGIVITLLWAVGFYIPYIS